MAAIGKAKPERMNSGLTKKKLSENACCWVLEKVDSSSPMPIAASKKSVAPASITRGSPINGTLNQKMPIVLTRVMSPSPMRKNGTVLPRMNSTGRIGLTMICSSVPTSRSRTIAKAVRLTTCSKVRLPITPGMKNQRSSRPELNQGWVCSVTPISGRARLACGGSSLLASSLENCVTI